MITYYCPQCWTIVNDQDKLCPQCGYGLGEFNLLSFEQKLLGSLGHQVPERRIMAAQILGNLGSQAALPEFKKLVAEEEDYFLLRAVLLAVTKIEHPERMAILTLAASHHSTLVANLAAELIQRVASQDLPGEWDRNTG